MSGAGDDWLGWARRLAALAQNGLTFATDAYDVVRYREVRAIAAEMLAARSTQPAESILAVLDREAGYATPKVDVRGVCIAEQRVLLVQEREDARWTLPGGWADPTDLPSEAAEREVREEAGYVVTAHRLLACWDRSLQRGAPPLPFSVYKLFFEVAVLGEVPRDDTETLDVGWFALDGLPPLSLGRVTGDQLARLAELVADPSRQTAFH